MSFTNCNLKFREYIGRSFLASVTSALLLSAATAQAATLTVTSASDSGGGTLRQAILNASSGDTINFAVGITTINLLSGELLIDKNLTINGPGPNLLTVRRSSGTFFRIFDVASAIITASISGLTITGGSAFNSNGGGIYNVGALTIINCTISANTSDSFGGGIYNAGLMTITNSTISGKTGYEGAGGGLENRGTVTLTNSTISGNSAGNSGGIRNDGGSTTITNSTISGNSAGSGGGISNFGGTVTITNSTISGNSASNGSGGGILNQGTVNSKNSIIALNTSASGPDVNGPLTSQGFNLIGNNAGTTITPAQSSDQIGVTPAQLNLGPLQDNGGPTFTRALLSGSPAIDKGNSSGSTTDQRGFTRPVGSANVSGGDGGDIGAFEVQAVPPTVLANISTRLLVGTGDDALIGGFIVTGTQPKKVLIRAIGPSLTLAGKLANPTLELRDSANTLLKQDDDWMNSTPADKQAIIDSQAAPTNNLESAIVATLPANTASYTAIVRGLNNTTGTGVVEIYDLDRTVDSKLANISTRGVVQTGDTVLIAGTIVLGPGSQKVIIRAIGPSLTIAGKLLDPTLELRDGNGTVLRSNDNWRIGGQETEIINSTVPPTNDMESALIHTLPGNGASYTAIVTGAGNTTGIAVIEVYVLN